MEMPTLTTFADEQAVRQRLQAAELTDAIEALSQAAGRGFQPAILVKLVETLQNSGAAPNLVARVLAQALSRPAAVWWACRAAREEHAGGVAEAELPALEAAEAWLRSPEQWRAHAANEAAKTAGLASPAGCAALAAFLAGESIGPSHLDPLPPEPQLAGMAAAAAVELAATRRLPEPGVDPWKPLIERGLAIAAGSDHWQVTATTATR